MNPKENTQAALDKILDEIIYKADWSLSTIGAKGAKQALSHHIDSIVAEVIGEDEPDIPMEAVKPEGTQLVMLNPCNKVKAEQRARYKKIKGEL